jgi:hypothetical protein
VIIDRTAAVTPTRFRDGGLRRHVGDLLGKATRDDMLRTFLWASECQIAREVCAAWSEHLQMLDCEWQDATDRKEETRPPYWGQDQRDQVTQGCHQAATSLLAALAAERAEARQAHQECTQVLDQLTHHFGYEPEEVPAADTAGAPLLDSLTPLRQQLHAARSRLTALIGKDRDTLHDLALQEASRRQNLGKDTSTSLAAIGRMSPAAFVDVVEAMLQRDGFTTTRPGAAGTRHLVLGTYSCGDTTLMSTHHTKGHIGSSPVPATTVGVPALHSVQVAADRLDHVGLIVAVTNGHFSAPARRYAGDKEMVLLDRSDLERWAEWQYPLACCDDSARDAA